MKPSFLSTCEHTKGQCNPLLFVTHTENIDFHTLIISAGKGNSISILQVKIFVNMNLITN